MFEQKTDVISSGLVYGLMFNMQLVHVQQPHSSLSVYVYFHADVEANRATGFLSAQGFTCFKCCFDAFLFFILNTELPL